jgi:hypothetical protein
MSVDRTSEKWKKRKALYIRKIEKANEVNSARLVKKFYIDDEILNLIVDADFMPKMPIALQVRESANERREFCIEIDAAPMNAEKVLRKATTDRPENAVRARLQSVAPLLGKTRYYAVRASAYKVGETSEVFIVRV